MVEAKLLRKKLKNGLIVDKWDLVTIIEKQESEIEALKAEKIRAYDNGVEDGKKSNTNPAKEQYKFGVDWSKDGNAVTVLKICEDGVAEVVFMDYQEVLNVPVKTLTDELELLETEIFVKDAIIKCYKEALEQIATGELTNEPNNYKDTVYVMRQIALNALAILRKAQEK